MLSPASSEEWLHPSPSGGVHKQVDVVVWGQWLKLMVLEVLLCDSVSFVRGEAAEKPAELLCRLT